MKTGLSFRPVSSMRALLLMMGIGLGSCQTGDVFRPRSGYPPDPWVKGYSNPNDCLGGEALAARRLELPDYPDKAFRTGRQGWTIVRLDVTAQGETENVEIERALPERYFAAASKRAVKDWIFKPPVNGALKNCRVLIRYKFGRVSLGS